MPPMLLAGEPVSRRGNHFTLVDAVPTDPRPVQERVPLLVGGNGVTVLRFGARHAAVVGVTGLGRTLAVVTVMRSTGALRG